MRLGRATSGAFLVDISGGTIQIDKADYDLVKDMTLYVGTNGYVYYSIWSNGRSRPYTLHALLMNQSGHQQLVDHINGDPLDNRRRNLRLVTNSKNQQNRHVLNKNNSSGHRGVARYDAKRWRASIMVDRRQIHLGLFHTIEDAVAARKVAELHYWGEQCPSLS